VSASIGAPLLENMEGRFFLRVLLFRGILGIYKRYANAMSTGISLHRGPVGKTVEGSLAGDF
jgi:hypothetical protein